MSTIRQILVATDFSEPSRAALDYATDFAKDGAAVDVLHVWEAPSFVLPGVGMVSVAVSVGAGAETLEELIRKSADHALAEFVDRASARGIFVRSWWTEGGRPAQAIVEAAESGEYDLIVVGTRGRSDGSRAFLGSVAVRVMRHAHCPVLCVPVPNSGATDPAPRPLYGR